MIGSIYEYVNLAKMDAVCSGCNSVTGSYKSQVSRNTMIERHVTHLWVPRNVHTRGAQRYDDRGERQEPDVYP